MIISPDIFRKIEGHGGGGKVVRDVFNLIMQKGVNMKSRIFSILALALILGTSLAIVGCSGGGTKFAVSDLKISPNPVEAGNAVTISATITNSGASGSCAPELNISGEVVNSTSVSVPASSSQTVNFTYTPPAIGSFNVSIDIAHVSIGIASGILGVIATPKGYWDIQYTVADGSSVTFNSSLAGIGGRLEIANLSTGEGNMTIRVSKSVVNGVRNITLLSSGWQLVSIHVSDVSPGVDMDVIMSLSKDAPGVLYVQNGIADVDMSSASSRTTTPKQIDTQGTGTNSPAGSMLVKTVLVGTAHTSVDQTILLPFGLTFTTGHITNVVSIPSTKFNGATLSDQGTPFAQTGPFTAEDNLPDYVGTPGTITTTGTGDCLGLTLVGIGIDFQSEIHLVLVPVSVTSGQ